MNRLKKQMAERLKALREASGFSQKEFASYLGINQGVLSKYECGVLWIPDTVKALLIQRGMSPEWLFSDTQKTPLLLYRGQSKPATLERSREAGIEREKDRLINLRNNHDVSKDSRELHTQQVTKLEEVIETLRNIDVYVEGINELSGKYFGQDAVSQLTATITIKGFYWK